jgi:hypothetical protein
MATIVKLWGDANPNKMLFFQQEINASRSTVTKFSIRIQIVSQIKLMVDFSHQNVIACDATFMTNEKKVL